jgi:hypothetical protein
MKTCHRIANGAKVRLVIDGIVMQTTMGSLRTGSISTVLHNAVTHFERQHAEHGWSGLAAAYRCEFLDRTVQIQIDLY